MTRVSLAECCRMRNHVRHEGVPATAVAETVGFAPTTVRRHARGDCRHDPPQCPYCKWWAGSLPDHLVKCDATDQSDDPEARADGGLPTRERVADAVRACHADGLSQIKARHVAARLETDHLDSSVAVSIGKHLSNLADRGALAAWSASSNGTRTTWEIVDIDALPEPEPEVRADGGPEQDPPQVTVGDRVTIIMRNDGEPEYVEGVVTTVHNPRTIDAVYRVESRAVHGGDGAFERDHHTDTYEFETSLVYMADVAGWLKGWNDA